MNIIEYIFEGHEEALGNMLVYDESGNVYVYCWEEYWERLDFFRDWFQDKEGYGYEEYAFIERKEYEKLISCDITFPQDEELDISYVRRPYYRMRGKPVSKEQAFDIIRRTDNFLKYIDEIHKQEEFVGNLNFDNWLIHKNHYPQGYGWIHTDGTVGVNAITQRWPKTEEFICEWFRYLNAFPYLDLIVALTDWNEINPRYYMEDNGYDIDYEAKEYDENFYDGIAMGIYVHDNKIQILNKEDTVKKYREYDVLYGKEREKFVPEYYGKNKIEQVNLAYLKKCIESYGLDAEEILSKQPRYEWERS